MEFQSYARDFLPLAHLPSTILFSVVVGLSVAWISHDFYAWRLWGTGGTPPTWSGYLRMNRIRFRHMMSDNNLLDTSVLSTEGSSYLNNPLPLRAAPRPAIVFWTMPQRQHPQPIDSSTRVSLHSLVQNLASKYPELLQVKPSHTEGKSTEGLYARPYLKTLNPVAKDKVLDHEIAHVHPADNSLHVWLSDPDAKKVIDAGWGQRFPLTQVKSGWTMVYAPRNDMELKVVQEIVSAGVSWLTGVAVN